MKLIASPTINAPSLIPLPAFSEPCREATVMLRPLFIPSAPLLWRKGRRKHVTTHICRIDCSTARIAILPPAEALISSPPATRRRARVSILTDFSSNPVAAVTDRASDPLSAAMLVTAAMVGCLASLVTRRPMLVSNAAQLPPATSLPEEMEGEDMDDGKTFATTPGENAIWLNMSIRTLWRLFRKSTNSLTRDVLQPVLDNMELPPLVRKVTITSLTLGESPALVRKIQRLPSRALSEVQYRFGLRLVGDKEGKIDMDVLVHVPGLERDLLVPVTVSSLDIQAKAWLGFTVIPFPPWIRSAQWALVKMPIVQLKIQVAKFIPITAIPVLSTILDEIFTKDVPREFLFPKTQVIDVMGDLPMNTEVEEELLKAQGIQTDLRELNDDKLRKKLPELVKLFANMDVDDDGVLNAAEVSSGLIEWGYASEADRNSIRNILDMNNDGFVQLREFLTMWGDLQNIFVPRRFRGVLTGVLLKAEGLRTPTVGLTDPYVVLSVESQSTTSKKNKATSKTGKGPGTAVWNEGWELFVQQPKTAMLRVEVREGCYFSFYRVYIPPPPQPVTHSGSGITLGAVEQANALDRIIGYGSIPVADLGSSAKSIWVDLSTGGGRVRLDVQFSEFVDPQFS